MSETHSSPGNRAAYALRLNPNKSNQEIAAEIGVSHETVRRIRIRMEEKEVREKFEEKFGEADKKKSGVADKKKSKEKQAFEIINANVEFRLEWVEIHRLSVPTELYQRDESEGKVAKEIAMHFDWAAFGVLNIAERENSQLHIMDGGTRWSGAKLRTDIPKVPCWICQLSDEEAAKVFLRINTNRRKLRVHQQQHAEVYAKEELALKADQYLKSFADLNIGFVSLAILRGSLKSGAHSGATNTICSDVLPKVASGMFISAHVFKGLIWVEAELRKFHETLNTKAYLSKLRKNMSGLDKIIAGAIIGAKRHGTGDRKTCGQALAKVCGIRIPNEE